MSVKIERVSALTSNTIEGQSNEVEGEYLFTKIADNECCVSVLNVDEVTKAVILDIATVDGEECEVTEIEFNGFMSAYALKRIRLPSTIKRINDFAFADCPNLTEIDVSSVQGIGEYAFMSCPALTDITIPRATMMIGYGAFYENDTWIHVRAEVAGAEWDEGWNDGNYNQDVEYNSQIHADLIYYMIAKQKLVGIRNGWEIFRSTI